MLQSGSLGAVKVIAALVGAIVLVSLAWGAADHSGARAGSVSDGPTHARPAAAQQACALHVRRLRVLLLRLVEHSPAVTEHELAPLSGVVVIGVLELIRATHDGDQWSTRKLRLAARDPGTGPPARPRWGAFSRGLGLLAPILTMSSWRCRH